MLKWAVGGGDQPPGGAERRSVTTPTSRQTLGYRQSLRKTAEKFHLLPSTDQAQLQPIKRAVIRNLNIHTEEGKENADEIEESSQEKRARDRSSIMRRLISHVTEKTANEREASSHVTDKQTNSRGPLGDVTNQSPVPSPRSGPKLTPARSKSRTRRSLVKAKTSTEADIKSESTKAKCSSCNSTPRRRIPKRTPKRRKQQILEPKLSPLKPSDLCINYSPEDSMLEFHRRLEESGPIDNPLYFSLKPTMQTNPTYMCINPSVSPIAQKMSCLKLSPQTKTIPQNSVLTNQPYDITDPRFLNESTLKNNVQHKESIELSPLNNDESILQSTLKNTITIENTLEESGKIRIRRYSETFESNNKTQVINRRRRYSDTMKISQTQLLLQALLKPDISPIKSEDSNIELNIQNSSSSPINKISELSMEIYAILQDNFKPPPPIKEETVIPNTKLHDLPPRYNTLPTPRLTPDLISTCWKPRNSISSYSELSVLGETWDSHRCHTILMQQNKATINAIPTMQDIDTPPILETKSLLDLTLKSNNNFQSEFNGTPLSENFDLKIQKAKILDLARPINIHNNNNNGNNIDILDIIDSVLHPQSEKKTVVKKFESVVNIETPNIGASFSQDPMTSDIRSPENTESPLAMVDKRSRSRRCLLYASPSVRVQPGLTLCRNKKRKKPRSSHPSRGEVKLALYNNAGLLTIHVISATNLLQKDQSRPASAFMKICVLARRSESQGSCQQGEVHRTNIRRPAPGPSGSPIYRFDQKFSLEVQDIADISEARVLVSVWLRPRSEKHRKSECVGCMSFGVQDVLENEVRGTFLVLSPSAGRSQYVAARSSGLTTGLSRASVMAEQSDSSVDDMRDIDTPKKLDRRRSAYRKTHSTPTANEDSVFLRHLELEPPPESGAPSTSAGRTPFTTTRKLARKPGSGFGFSVAWTQPPRVERVEAGLPADRAGLRPGDYIIFVESHNVVTMPEEEILSLIRLSNNHLTLEVYRRTTPNGVVLQQSTSSPAPQPPPAQRRSASVTDCSAATSLDLRRRLQLPQVAFTTEHSDVLSQGGLTAEEARKRAVYQLLQRLQNFALATHFGVERFLVPLSDRKDLLTSQDHLTLFQNMEELVMLTEELLEQLLVGDDADSQGANLGRVYLNKIQALTNAYRKYCMGLKRADCLLAQKTASPEFMRVTSEPPIPKRRPDLTTFLHKPLEHYRETLKLLQTVLKNSKVNDDEYACLTKIVLALQTTYRDITANSGLMEPDGDGRLLLSLQDLESRLVFTKCKPFVLSTGGRQWIFGGDLSRVDGRALRPFWALLFTDLLLLAKVSRDRVLFVTDEPISLLDVTQACFSVKKKDTEFRLIVDAAPHSPAEVAGGKQVKTKHRRRSIAFRAPTPELKAVWQNLLQRQIIYLNTVRGGTPNASPLDSPAEQPSLTTADSPSRVQLEAASTGSQRHLDQLIEQKCRLLGKSGLHKGSALHLQQWMTGQLGAHQTQSPVSPEEPEPEIWSPGTLRKRGEQLMGGGMIGRTESRCEEYEMSSPDPERSLSRSTDDSQQSQVTVKSGHAYYKKAELTLENKQNIAVESKVEKTVEISQDVKVVSSASSTSPSISSQASYSPNFKPTTTTTTTITTTTTTTNPSNSSVAMCKDCLETCAGQNCPSAHRTRQKVRAQILELWRRKFTSQIETVVPKVREDSSSDYDSEEGDRWEPLPSELGITLQRDPFYPQEDHRLPTIAVLPPTPSETRSLSGSTTGSQKAFDWDGTDELVAAAEACALPDEEDEEDENSEDMERAGPNEDGNPPYRSLSNSNLRKYGTLTSLENVENANDETTDATADESDDDEQYIEESPNESFATVRYERSESSVKSVTTASSGSDSGALVTIDAMHQSMRGWSSRHGATVAEKTKLFEKISEQSKGNHVSIERFLPNPIASGIPPVGVFNIPRTISSSIFVPGNDEPTQPIKTPPQVMPRIKKQQQPKTEPTSMPRTVPQLSKEHHNKAVIPSPATVPQPVVRHTVVMGTTATLKSKAPAVPVRSKIYSSFKTAKAAAPPPPIPAKPLELNTTARPKSPEISTSAAAAAAIAAANQVGSPDSSVSDKDEWGTPEGNDPDDTEEELSSTQDIVSLFPCVGSDQLQGQRSWSPDEDDQLTTLLSAPPRVFPRRRLEPLYEEEDGETQRPRPRLLSDSSSSGSSTPEHTKVVPSAPRRGCMVPGQGSWADVCADIETTPAISGSTAAGGLYHHQLQGKHLKNGEEDMKEQTLRGSSGLLQRLKLASSRRRGWGGVEPIKTSPRNTTQNKILGSLLGNNRSEDNNGNNPTGGRGLLRIFGNNNNNNNNAANNTVNNKEGTTARLDQDKILDRRFWKQLKRRRSGSINNSSSNSSNPPIAV